MNDRNIQHPDITEAERTGYPRRRKVSVTLTDRVIRNYLNNQSADFIEYCLYNRSIVDGFLDDMREDFEEWCKEALEA